MSYLEIDKRIISTTDIVEIEEKLVTVQEEKQVKNPEPKPQKGFFAKMLYSETITKTIERKFSVVVIKVKAGMQVVTHTDQETGATRNSSHQLFDFFAVCKDRDFCGAVMRASNRKDVEIEIGNYYCYPGMLRYPDYITTNVLIDPEICSKADFMRKYMN